MFASNLGAKNTMRSSNERCPSLPMALILGLVTFFEPSMALMNLASPIACGQSKIIERPRHMRIIGGKPSAHGQFPWTVSLRKKISGRGSHHTCAGSLISNRHIVTAAHCLHRTTKDMWEAVLGEHHPEAFDNGEQIMKIEKMQPHPDYVNGMDIRNDIAIIRLSENVQFTEYVSPICLPNINQTIPGADGILAGWG